MEYLFDHEKLEVYQLELKFVTWVTDLMDEAKASAGSKATEPCDHLDRGSLSFLYNTAEGNGRRHPKMRARFFGDARGSALECAACLDSLVAKRIATIERVDQGKRLLHRIVSILTRLVEKFSGYALGGGDEPVVREIEAEYLRAEEEDRRRKGEDEHEHEQEHEHD